jgi:hypothetical protein
LTARFLYTLALVAMFTAPGRADRAADVLTQLNHVATALTDGNALDAMSPFDKSFADYDKLSSYFDGLTSAFQLANEAKVADEQDTETETKLTVDWTLTLTDLGTGYSEQRTGQINIRFILKDGKWKIVNFSPIDLFNPAQKRKP